MRRNPLALLRTATRLHRESRDPVALAAAYCELLGKHLECSRVWVAAPPPQDSPLASGHLLASHPPLDTPPLLSDPRLPATQALTALRPAFAHDLPTELGGACGIWPLLWDQECIGLLGVHGDAASEDNLELLTELADRLAAGLYNRREQLRQQQAETRLRNESEAIAALHRILALSLERRPLEEKLDQVLEILFDISWLRIERKGAIFVADNERQELQLLAKRHLSPVLHQLCAQVAYGHCLCGKAAKLGPVFRAHVDADHHTTFPGIEDHGHYCQPIRQGDTLLGVLNLYVAPGHQEQAAERLLVQSVADAVAGIIARDRVESQHARLAAVVEASPDYVCIATPAGTPIYFNPAAGTLLHCRERPDKSACRLDHLFSPRTADRLRQEGIPQALTQGVWQAEGELRLGEAAAMPVSQVILAPRDERGAVEFIATICRDIRDRKKVEEAARDLALREQQFANVLINSLPGIFFLLDRDGYFIRWNANLEQVLGLPAATLGRLKLWKAIHPDDADNARAILSRLEGDNGGSLEFSLGLGRTQGPHYLVHVSRLGDDSPGGAAVLGVGFDISERKALEAELERNASRDFLTGAYNRRKLREEMHREIDKSTRYRRPVSLLLFDLDHFKSINDRYGHDAGDAVLREVVARTQSCLRLSDLLARWGGEEFVVLAPETCLENATVLAEKIRGRLSTGAFPTVGRISASFGVAEYQPGENGDQWSRRADAALYDAKARGRDQVCQAAD